MASPQAKVAHQMSPFSHVWAQISTPVVLSHWMEGSCKKIRSHRWWCLHGGTIWNHEWIQVPSAGDLSGPFSWWPKWRKGKSNKVDRICKRRHHKRVCSFPLTCFFKMSIYWAASGLSCGMWGLSLQQASLVAMQKLQAMGSVVAMLQLSCPAAYGALVPQEG